MRKGFFLGGALLATMLVAVACDHSAPFTVEKARLGEKSPLVTGDMMRLVRPAQEGYEGAAPGYHVVRSPEEWAALFPQGQAHPPPAAADFTRSMIVVSSGTRDMTDTKIHRVLDTANTLHVYIGDTIRGQGCVVEKGTPLPYQIAITDRIDKPVKVHVDSEQAQSCGAAPLASVKCRVQTSETWAEKITANPGDAVECEATIDAKGKFVVVDKSWSWAELPGGTLSKMTFSHEGLRVAFNVDLFGTYKAAFEVADEVDRRGNAVGAVDVSPPKSPDLFIQMLWAGFDANDDPSTFPRVELVVKDMPPRGQKEKTCSLAEKTKPDFCDIKGAASSTDLRMTNSGTRPFLVGVHYTDDRYDGGPYVCLRVYLNGARTAETCDRTKRGADDEWALGAVEGKSGTFMDAGQAYALSQGLAFGDAGAPMQAGDAGASTPSTTPTAKPKAKPAATPAASSSSTPKK